MERFANAAFSFEVSDTASAGGTAEASSSCCTAFRRTAAAGTG